MNARTTGTPDPDNRPAKDPDKFVGPIDPRLSGMVFDLYDGKNMTRQDVRDARYLAALWQIAMNLRAVQEQSAANTIALIKIINKLAGGECKECGR